MANTSRNFLIKFGADANSVTKAIRSIKSDIGSSISLANSTRNAFRFTGDTSAVDRALSGLRSSLSNADAASKQLKQNLAAGLNTGSIEQGTKAYSTMSNQITRLDSQTQKLKASIGAMSEIRPPSTVAYEKKIADLKKSTLDTLKSLGTKLQLGGGAIAAVGTQSLKSFGTFQSSLNKAAVIAGGTSKDIGTLGDTANKMGAELPLSAQDSADAMIQMAQAGANVGQIKEQFPAIAKASTAAGSDLQTTASTVQSAMNIWSNSLKSPTQAAAILTDSANISNASIEDMNQAMSNVGGNAAAMGMDMTTTSNAIGLLTNTGASAAQASQDLNHALVQIQSPSAKAQNAMKQLNFSYLDAKGNMKSFPQILADLNKALSGKSATQQSAYLVKMFGTAGMQAIRPLLKAVANQSNNTQQSWSASMKQMVHDTGDTATSTNFLNKQAKEMQKNVGSSIEQVSGNWESLRNTAMQSTQKINGGYIEMLNKGLTWAQGSQDNSAKFIRGFIGMSPAIGAGVTATGTFLKSVGTIGETVGGSVKSISNLGKTIWGIGKVTAGVPGAADDFKDLAGKTKIAAAAQGIYNTAVKVGTGIMKLFDLATDVNPIVLITLAITAAIVAFTLFVTKTKTGQKMLKDVADGFSKAFSGIGKLFTDMGKSVSDFFSGIASWSDKAFDSAKKGVSDFFKSVTELPGKAGKALGSLGSSIGNWASGVFNSVTGFFGRIPSAIGEFFGQIPGLLNTAINGMLQSAGTFVGWLLAQIAMIPFKIFNGIKSAIGFVGSFFATVGQMFSIGIQSVFNFVVSLPQTIGNIFKSVSDWIGGIFTAAENIAINSFNAIVNFVKGIPAAIGNIFNEVSNWVGGVFNGLVGFAQNAFNRIVNFFAAIPGAIANAFGSVVSFVGNALSAAWGTIVNWGQNIGHFFGQIPKYIKEGLSGIWDVGKYIVQGIWGGITGAFEWLVDKVKVFGGAVVKSFRHYFKVGSPSKLMRDELGVYIAQGIGVGIADNVSAATAPIKDIKDGIMDQMNGFAVTPRINPVYSTPDLSGSGNRTIINNFTINNADGNTENVVRRVLRQTGLTN
jgi:TP901 family phage tail tape measure protein